MNTKTEKNRETMTREEKARSLGQECFPDANNIWARPNYEAQLVANACIKMAEWERERLVERACERLREIAHLYVSDFTGELDDNGLVEHFKREMEV